MSYDDPDAFRVPGTLNAAGRPIWEDGPIRGFVSSDWPRMSPADLREMLRRAWDSGWAAKPVSAPTSIDSAVAARDEYVISIVPLRDWEKHDG